MTAAAVVAKSERWPAEAFADRAPAPGRSSRFALQLDVAHWRASLGRQLDRVLGIERWDRRRIRAAVGVARRVLGAGGSLEQAGRQFAYWLVGADATTRSAARMLIASRAAKGNQIADLRAVDHAFGVFAKIWFDTTTQPVRRVPHGMPRDALPVEDAKRVPLERVFAHLGFELRRAGREWVTRCPFHDDAHPSMTVNVERGLWYCFPCGMGGDSITFLQQYRRVDFATAVREVAAC